MLASTMQDFPLTVQAIFRHGRRVHARSEVHTFFGDRVDRATFAEIGDRAERLAAALHGIGVRAGDRVGTFMWNNQRHLEAYLGVPSMGAVLHTLNIRLFPEQLAYIINHAEDQVIIVDDSLIPLLARIRDQLTTVRHIIVAGDGDASALANDQVLRYESLLADVTWTGELANGFPWPEIDERQAAAMCYTSGTTGNPKGVAYSHRSTFLHTMCGMSASTVAFTEHDRAILIVPMFHANAWGMPYEAWFSGADLVMPQQYLQAEPLTRLIAETKPTFAGAIPTIWADIVRYGEEHELDLSSLRMIVCGGSAVPRVLMERLQDRYDVRMVQAWGMTETSPIAAMAHVMRDIEPGSEEEWSYRVKTGRVVAGVELRITDDSGTELAWDGKSVGEIEVRGPWITGSYWKDPSPEKFHDGWLRTGDVGCVDPDGYIQITDRAKDVVKSGGEWISSVEIEGHLMAHPNVVEAAVVGVPDPRWDERPLACVVRRPGATITPEELRAFLSDRIAKWWLPERWTFIDEVPKTSVGKFDKKVLRAAFADGGLDVEVIGGAER